MGARAELIDAYAVLGVAPDASQAELKAAHRRLVRRHHPDLAPPEKRPAATERVQQVNVAYGLVRDERRRLAYDRLRAAQRRRETVATADTDLARRWEELLASAGRWAGVWWARNRAALERSAVAGALAARRAGQEVLAGVYWVAVTLAGALLGAGLGLAAGGLVVPGVGALSPVAGVVAGAWMGADRGRRGRRRMARLPPPARPAVLTPLIGLLGLAAAVGVDALLGA